MMDVSKSVEGAELRLLERHYTFHSKAPRSPSLRDSDPGSGGSVISLASFLWHTAGELAGQGWRGTLESAGILCGSLSDGVVGKGSACLLLKSRLAGMWNFVFTSMNND